MNVGYKEMNCADVGKALKLDKSTIAAWCRKGYINFVDVSEPESKRPRYLIPQWEYERVRKLIAKFGKRNWMMYNEKDKVRAAQEHVKPIEEKKVEEQGETEFMFIDRPDLAPVETPEDVEAKRILNELASGEVESERVSEELKPKFDPEKTMNTLLYIQEIKERLNDLEAEKNQLIAELEQCRNEVIDAI